MPQFQPQFLRSSLPDLNNVEPSLKETIEYVLDSEGSLARAQLSYSVAHEFRLPEATCRKIACGIELFHIASLLLDDLPCMDDAATRRGKPCPHSVYGESAAVLSSLAFINRAYSLLWRSMIGLPEAAATAAADMVEECLGLCGLVNGQALDLNFQRTDRSSDTVEQIATLKTGALFRLCLLFPAIVAQASRYEKMHLTRISSAWGQAYQIADDLKDVLFGEAISGKTAQRDETLGRPNRALAGGISTAFDSLNMCIRESASSLEALSSDEANAWSSLKAFHDSFLLKVEPLLATQEVA